MRFGLPVAFLALFLSITSFAAQGECDNDMCIAFEVTLNFDGYQNTPLVFGSTSTANVGGTTLPYDSIVTRSEYSCTKQVKVLKETYFAIKNVMTSFGGQNGEQPPVLTPMQQHLLAFYVTLMRQTEGFTCSPSDFSNADKPGPLVSGPSSGNGNVIQMKRGVIDGVMGDGPNALVFVTRNDGSADTIAVGEQLYPGCTVVGVNMSRNTVSIERDGVRSQIEIGQSF